MSEPWSIYPRNVTYGPNQVLRERAEAEDLRSYERRIYGLLASWADDQGRVPKSMREILALGGYNVDNTHRFATALRRKGLLRNAGGKHPDWRLTKFEPAE